MSELEARIREILGKLQLLSEAKSAPVASSTSHGKPDTQAPPGALPDRDSAKPPPKDRSLFEWYAWQFDNAKDDYRRRLLCYLAERDYENVRRRIPDRRRGVKEEDRGEPETEEVWATRIVQWYEGLDAVEVAILEECSEGAVTKARRIKGRNERDGRERSAFLGMEERERHIVVLRCKDKGMSQNAAAAKLGVSKRTVGRYWEDPDWLAA